MRDIDLAYEAGLVSRIMGRSDAACIRAGMESEVERQIAWACNARTQNSVYRVHPHYRYTHRIKWIMQQ